MQTIEKTTIKVSLECQFCGHDNIIEIEKDIYTSDPSICCEGCGNVKPISRYIKNTIE